MRGRPLGCISIHLLIPYRHLFEHDLLVLVEVAKWFVRAVSEWQSFRGFDLCRRLDRRR
jgi:hypothetical protein